MLTMKFENGKQIIKVEPLVKIPSIKDPLGQYWRQPSSDNMLVDDKYALMTLEDFNQLRSYTFSNPSGVYNGKMWKAQGFHLVNGGFCIHDAEWFLCWYDKSDKGEDYCSIQTREIVFINN